MAASPNSTEGGDMSTTISITTTTERLINISKGMYDDYARYFDMYINPITCLIGIIGNTYSLVVIKRIGLKKSSDILVFWTAVIANLLLLGKNNIVGNWMVYAKVQYFRTEWETYLCYSLYLFWHLMSVVANFSLLYCPLFMVIERLIVIFFPLHVQTIITKPRVWAVCLIPTLLYTGYAIAWLYARYWIGWYCAPQWNGLCLGIAMMKSNVSPVWNDFEVHFLANIGTVLIIAVVLGTIIIGIKITLAMIAKRKMTADLGLETKKNAAASRTTQKLLVFCVTYCIAAGLVYIIGVYISYNNVGFYLQATLQYFKNLIMIIYCSVCFVINFLMNPKFKNETARLLACGRKVK